MMDALVTLAIAVATGLTSAVASWAAMRVTIFYMKRDIERAQFTADKAREIADVAHRRLDRIHGYRSGTMTADPDGTI